MPREQDAYPLYCRNRKIGAIRSMRGNGTTIRYDLSFESYKDLELAVSGANNTESIRTKEGLLTVFDFRDKIMSNARQISIRSQK